MTLFLQGFQNIAPCNVTPRVRVRCRCCGVSFEITGAQEIDVSEGLTQDDIQESITAALDNRGWENMNCTHCALISPDLCKEDEE